MTLERSEGVFTGLKTGVVPPLFSGAALGVANEVSEGTQVVVRWCDRAMGWAAKQGTDPSFWRCSVVTKRGNERSESGSPFVGTLRFDK